MKKEQRLVKMVPTVWKFVFSRFNGSPNTWGWHQARELLEVINNILEGLEQKPMTTDDLLREYPFITPYVSGESVTCYWNVTNDGRIWSTAIEARENWLEDLVIRDALLPAGIGVLFIEAVKDPIGSMEKKLAWMKMKNK
jgi:hypothetical protein